MMQVVAVQYDEERVVGLRWVDPLVHRTGSISIERLLDWLESVDNPLIFVGVGIWAARLAVRRIDGLPALVGTRGRELVIAPLQGLPRY